MATETDQGIVQTVLGPIQPSELGSTMTHEHLIIDFSMMLRNPRNTKDLHMMDAPVTMENLGWINQYCYSNKDNLLVTEEQTAISECIRYKKQGGGTIVDATTIGIGRNPEALARISQASSVNIIMGAGYYVDAVHPSSVNDLTVDQIAEQIYLELTKGVGETGIKAGIIGEIGCTWPLTSNEIKILKASSAAQIESGASILIHPGRHESAPLEILNVLERSGANLSRVIMGHLDRTVDSITMLKRIAETGCTLEWDLFGNEVSYYQPSDFDMPSDAQRLEHIRIMLNEGLQHSIVVAHDICTKHRLATYGGHGYGHFLGHVVPRMIEKGFTKQEIHSITDENPKRLLTLQRKI